MIATIHRLMRAIGYVAALLGGIVLSAIILMVGTSILGSTISRTFRSEFMQTWVPGLSQSVLSTGVGAFGAAYETLEFGMPFVIFCFLVWCQVTAGHATVDIFTDGLRPRSKRVLIALIEVVFAAVLVIVALQLYEGVQVQARRGTTTYLQQWPIWRSYQAASFPAFAAALIACWMALVRLGEAALNRRLITAEQGAEH
jgi:hypothetical protein